MSQQTGWKFCNKCHALFFGPNVAQSRCPGGGTHDASASGNYLMQFGDSTTGLQGGWRFCHKCAGLFFNGNPTTSRTCPAGGLHDASQSGHYVMGFGEDSDGTQGNWRFCKNCFGLFFFRPGGNGHDIEFQGVCSAEGSTVLHDSSESAHYRMLFEQAPQQPPVEPEQPAVLTFDAGSITSGLSIGGFARVVLSNTGEFTLTVQMHDSGAVGINYVLTAIALTPSGIAYTVQATGHCAGTFSPGSRDSNPIIVGSNDKMRDNFSEIRKAQVTFRLDASDTTTPLIADALQAALITAAQSLGGAAVKGIVNLL